MTRQQTEWMSTACILCFTNCGIKVQIGGEEQYVSLCRRHWREKMDAAAAVEYLRDKGAQRDGGPWCLYVGLLYPHWP